MVQDKFNKKGLKRFAFNNTKRDDDDFVDPNQLDGKNCCEKLIS